MPTYQISLDKKLDEIATAAASETRITVNQFLNAMVRENLKRLETVNQPGASP